MLSAVLLGVVLVKLEHLIGMSVEILFRLAGAACLLCLYSLSCSLLRPSNWRPFLKGIALANLSYCLVTSALLIKLSKTVRPLGWVYFSAELVIVIALGALELAVARNPEQ